MGQLAACDEGHDTGECGGERQGQCILDHAFFFQTEAPLGMKYGVPFIAVQGLKKAWLLKTDQCCLGWGNMEHTVAPLRLTWGFGIPVGSKLKWPQGMESH